MYCPTLNVVASCVAVAVLVLIALAIWALVIYCRPGSGVGEDATVGESATLGVASGLVVVGVPLFTVAGVFDRPSAMKYTKTRIRPPMTMHSPARVKPK